MNVGIPDTVSNRWFALRVKSRCEKVVAAMAGQTFQAPDGFPTVPRLGFHWQVSDVIVIKGESYFALTNTCVMAGGRLEAVFDGGAVRAWFTAYADFLVAWDPFHYDIGVGVEIGASLHFEV